MQEIGYCSGIENYSRYFDRRKIGERPFCLLDCFPKDYITFIDESHVSLPQIRAMWKGDKARKMNLIDHGFRLPSAIENRPLSFEEFESITNQVIYVSATPSEYEIIKTKGVITEQIIRPTGVIDPSIDIKPTKYQIEDLITEIKKTIAQGSRVLIITLTKKNGRRTM